MDVPRHSSLGPLQFLVGTWEGQRGTDVAPSPARKRAVSKYREHTVFAPIGRVDNHEQTLYGLRYRTTAWRIDESTPFHEEVGFWLWEPGACRVMRCFLVPRGVSVIAGGHVPPTARSFTLRANLGDPSFGICSNPFLHREFRTVAYRMTVEFRGHNTLYYEEDTVLQIPGRNGPFHHTDANTLRRIGQAPSSV